MYTAVYAKPASVKQLVYRSMGFNFCEEGDTGPETAHFSEPLRPAGDEGFRRALESGQNFLIACSSK